NLVAETGANVRAELPLLTIMPDNAQLQAILLVPTRAYGFVQPGQRTRLRFDAFPYQRFGLYEGEVIKTAQASGRSRYACRRTGASVPSTGRTGPTSHPRLWHNSPAAIGHAVKRRYRAGTT
ncbi:HlyD family efflux transporter periplasmic adaptor subunit, partial [Arsukibacterium sp.]|uniref:HlyD family efflux transporter periplasmic adaptor subunit n=1 Tax=Arsukibacterium sp. TaxID=1977258 RepID=UPI002FDB66BB